MSQQSSNFDAAISALIVSLLALLMWAFAHFS